MEVEYYKYFCKIDYLLEYKSSYIDQSFIAIDAILHKAPKL